MGRCRGQVGGGVSAEEKSRENRPRRKAGGGGGSAKARRRKVPFRPQQRDPVDGGPCTAPAPSVPQAWKSLLLLLPRFSPTPEK